MVSIIIYVTQKYMYAVIYQLQKQKHYEFV